MKITKKYNLSDDEIIGRILKKHTEFKIIPIYILSEGVWICYKIYKSKRRKGLLCNIFKFANKKLGELDWGLREFHIFTENKKEIDKLFKIAKEIERKLQDYSLEIIMHKKAKL